ncbi:MAG: biosynthetic-type acetolactate synthase large subunit [Negativicutes bacterium]|nr:biosynthetic-type acetolactate synthase large subunit [Negativicutes bacterium]
MRLSGAAIIVECLKEQGVDTVFGYPGGAILPLYDALLAAPILHVLTAHEQGAAHAADGYARASGKVGVCIATSGPGATNLVTGLAAAFMDSVPVVAITGQVPTSLLGRDAFQEVDITGITMPITKHNFIVKDVKRLAEILRYAFKIASSGRPGPVLVDVPRDVQTAHAEFTPAVPSEESNAPVPAAQAQALAQAAAAISQAERPLIVVGGGAVTAGASREIRTLAEKCRIPVVSTLMGLGAFPASHELFLGMTGMHGSKPANNAVHAADVIIAVGSRFSDRVTGDRQRYTQGKILIHIDVDPAEIHKNVDTHLGLVGNTPAIIAELAAACKAKNLAGWQAMLEKWRNEASFVYREDTLNAPWIMRHIAAQTADGSYVYVTDVGQHQMWAAQHLAIEAPRTWLTSGGLGAMGFGLPAAVGAQFGVPDKRVIHFAGDGGFKMTGAELYTAANHDLPIISIIINNNCLGMIRQLQHVFFDRRYTACALKPVDFTAFAGAFGIKAMVASSPDEFAQAFALALKTTGPVVIVANIATDDLVTPMTVPGTGVNQFVSIP